MYNPQDPASPISPLELSSSSEHSSRPGFSSTNTSARLEERARRPSSISMSSSTSNLRKQARKSAFIELGLENDRIANDTGLSVRRAETAREHEQIKHYDSQPKHRNTIAVEKTGRTWFSRIINGKRPVIKANYSPPPNQFTSFSRVALIALLIAVVVPGFDFRGKDGKLEGADAVVLGERAGLDRREDNSTDVCTRWSHQSAVVNGTMYIYGGRASTTQGQTEDTWNNNLLSLELASSWTIASPSLTGLPQPSGPPAVANGYLWSTYNSLFLYGGEFSDSPAASPVPLSIWEYAISSSTWTSNSSPTTVSGNNSAAGGMAVQRSAEGAGLSVPELGVSWYFGGHQDMYTTAGWSNQIARIYLKSLLEFTHPGYQNTGVSGLGVGGTGAPSTGAFRNITTGGIEDTSGFTERADGVLVYVPGWGPAGILLGLAGGVVDGDTSTVTEMTNIDVYDIASSTWYKQTTTGTSPTPRVNACAVVFAAPDGSSFQVHLYGGQTLSADSESQTQMSDMWILTIPSFTWVQVDASGSIPAGRAGHTCHASDGQIVVVGGYLGADAACDNPGIYVFNASSLAWTSSYTSLSVNANDVSPLDGSTGYTVPEAVQSIIGGSPSGSATISSPAISATGGPIATGHAPVWTITQSVTSTPTSTGTSISTNTTQASNDTSDTPSSKLSKATIAVIIVAVLLAALATYLAFCTYLYRRQLNLYRRHVAMSQRYSGGTINYTPYNNDREKFPPLIGTFGTDISGRNSDSVPVRTSGASGSRSAATSGRRGYEGLPGGNSEEIGIERMRSAETAYLGSELRDTMDADRGSVRTNESMSSSADLLRGQEMSFFSVVMSPRRTLRVINRD